MPKAADITGQTFGKLTAQYRLDTRTTYGNRILWQCLCDCGNIVRTTVDSLRSGNSSSCGCYKVFDLIKMRFGRLLVVSKLDIKGSHGRTLWVCLCDCGTVCDVSTGCLNDGSTKSCGCLARDTTIQLNKNRKTHGLSRTPIYQTWNAMIQRCYNVNSDHYSNYGGRGIAVCDRWLESFENFYADMGAKPSDDHSIDRIDNDGNYEPSNCKWSTSIEQCNNRRSNRVVIYRGKRFTKTQLARVTNMNAATLQYRLNAGWSVEDAVNK